MSHAELQSFQCKPMKKRITISWIKGRGTGTLCIYFSLQPDRIVRPKNPDAAPAPAGNPK
jgi:hypothetical protein